jgi:hypothetical protein
MAFSTFRQIGARNKIQGGTRFANLAVNNSLNLANSKPIYSNNELVQSTFNAIEQSAILIGQLARVVRNTVEEIYATPLSAIIIGNIISNVSDNVKRNTDFLSNVATKLIRDKYTNFFSLWTDPTFVPSIENILIFEKYPLVSENVLGAIVTNIIQTLPNKIPFMRYLSTKIYPLLLLANRLNNEIDKINNPSYTYTFAIPPNILYNKVSFNIYTFTLNQYTNYSCLFNIDLQFTAPLTRVTVKGFNIDTNTLHSVFYDQAYSTMSAALSKNITFTKILDNTSEAFTMRITIYCEVVSDFVTCNGLIYFTISPLDVFDFPIISLECPMYIDAAPTNIKLYGGSTISPINSSSEPTTYNESNSRLFTEIGSYTIDPNHIPQYYDPNGSQNEQVTDYKYNGLAIISLQDPVWWINLKFIVSRFIETTIDYSVYMVANVNGPVVVNVFSSTSISAFRNIYNGGLPIMLMKFKRRGTVEWFANISSVANSIETLNGITSDIGSNIYVYGTHPSGDRLFAYNSDFTFYSENIDDTPSQDIGGRLYGSNAFNVKYDPSGKVLGFLTIKGYDNQSINNVYVDPNSNAVYLACSSTGTSVVYSFNNKMQIFIPNKGRAFIVRTNNVDSKNVTNSFAMVVATKVNTTTLEYDFDTSTNATSVYDIAAVKVCTNSSGEMFALYVTKPTVEFVDLYNVNNDTEPSIKSVAGKVIIVKYTLENQISWYYSINTLFLIYDNAQQMCVNSDNDVYIICRTVSTLFFFTKQVPLQFVLPNNEVDVNFLFKISDIDEYNVTNPIAGFAVISNCSINKMYAKDNVIYVLYSYRNFSTVYVFVNNNYKPKIYIGGDGKQGNALVRFYTQNAPSTTVPIIDAVLISFTVNV